MAKITLLFICMCLLIACDPLKEGKVISKRVEPARDYVYMMPIPHTIRSGKTSTTYYTYIPVWMHDDEDYVITLDGFTENEHKEVQRDFYISKARYDMVSIGQGFCIDDGCSESPNNDKEK
jgi:hypothetical protein